jgi:hypothetical protein
MFHRVLERLHEAAEQGTRGAPADRCVVQRRDLIELLGHFHRLDREMRDLHSLPSPERKESRVDSFVNNIKLWWYVTTLPIFRRLFR